MGNRVGRKELQNGIKRFFVVEDFLSFFLIFSSSKSSSSSSSYIFNFIRTNKSWFSLFILFLLPVPHLFFLLFSLFLFLLPSTVYIYDESIHGTMHLVHFFFFGLIVDFSDSYIRMMIIILLLPLLHRIMIKQIKMAEPVNFVVAAQSTWETIHFELLSAPNGDDDDDDDNSVDNHTTTMTTIIIMIIFILMKLNGVFCSI